MMSAKMATPAFLKTKFFSRKAYGVIDCVNHAADKILSRDSNYIVDVVM